MKKLILSFLILSGCSPLKEYADTKAVFEKEVSALEKLDVASTASKNELLFVGSSSVRLWDNIKNDMSPYKSVKRGYGGAHYYDLIHFTDRLVTSHNPKAILLFVANDITGPNDIFKPLDDLSPKEVKRLFKYCYNSIRKTHADVPIFVIETTPTPSRWGVWEKISEANDLIKTYCDITPNLYFIDTREKFLKNDKPISSLFVSDELHLNKTGYNLWGKIIKTKLKESGL